MRLRPLKSRWRPRGLTTAPESRCEPGCLPFSSTATGTSPSRSAVAGSSSTSWPRRIAQASPAGPAPTTRIPTSIGSASPGTASASCGSNGGGNLAGIEPISSPFLARTSSVSFGTTWCRSPTTPRSLNSKMGAFASLLIATITFELCMPTLCWIAPEIPQAT